MKILIDDVKLNLLLETKKSFIGKNVAWDSFLSAFHFSSLFCWHHTGISLVCLESL